MEEEYPVSVRCVVGAKRVEWRPLEVVRLGGTKWAAQR